MKTLFFVAIAFSLAFFGCSSKSEFEKTAEKFHTFIKDGKFDEAWKMTDKETQEIVPRESFDSEAQRIRTLVMFTQFKEAKVNPEKTEAVVPTVFTGQRADYNKLEKAKITFYVYKNGEKYEIKMKDMVEDIKKQQKAYEEAIAFTPESVKEMEAAAALYKDKIEVKELKNGEVTFTNGMSQYMMEATIKNNSDKPFSFIGVLVKFMDDADSKVLFEKTFFLIYTRQVAGIYPIKPKEEKNTIIPGYDAGDIQGNWTGKLKWEVVAVKVATPDELVTLD